MFASLDEGLVVRLSLIVNFVLASLLLLGVLMVKVVRLPVPITPAPMPQEAPGDDKAEDKDLVLAAGVIPNDPPISLMSAVNKVNDAPELPEFLDLTQSCQDTASPVSCTDITQRQEASLSDHDRANDSGRRPEGEGRDIGSSDRMLSLWRPPLPIGGGPMRGGDIKDLDRQIELCRERLDLFLQPEVVVCLGGLLLERRELTRNYRDLDEAILLLREAVPTLSYNHILRVDTSHLLATGLHIRYGNSKDVSDLEEAILHYRIVHSSRAVDTPARLSSFILLATSLLTLHKRLGGISYLQEAILCLRDALSLSTGDHHSRLPTLNTLANALFLRYESTVGSISDLKEAVLRYREVLQSLQADHPDRPSGLTLLACRLLTLHKRLGKISDLQEAILHLQEALSRSAANHPGRLPTLNTLANALLIRYEGVGSIHDLDQAIDLHREALTLRDKRDPHRPASLNNLASTLFLKYEALGHLSDLEEAIFLCQEALSLDPGRSSCLNNLARALLARYTRSGGIRDLEDAVMYHRQALSLRSGNHPDRPSSLSNLADALLTRYERYGSTSNLEEAIIYLREALSHRAGNHSARPSNLNTLATALAVRSLRSGSTSDLEEAIRCLQEALSICHSDNPSRSAYIHNLADILFSRYERMTEIDDLETSIRLYEEALSLRRGMQPQRPVSLARLGFALLVRYRISQQKLDLERGMHYFEESFSLFPSRHSFRQTALLSFLKAFSPPTMVSAGDKSLLRERCMELAALTPQEHPQYAAMACLTAPILPFCHYQWGLDTSDLLAALGLGLYPGISADDKSSDFGLNAEDAMLALLQRGSRSLASPSIDQLKATCEWLKMSSHLGRPLSLEMYGLMLDHLDLAVARGCSLDIRHHQLSSQEVLLQAKRLVPDAVMFAIELGAIETAVQFYERGRSILLTQLSSDRLRSEWGQMVEKIRTFEGFEDFLRPAPFNVLQKAASEGPVILLNIARLQSHAIIVTSRHTPIVVPLPSATPEYVESLVTRFFNTISNDIRSPLLSLWEDVGKPIVSALGAMDGVPKGSRVWWCLSSAVMRLPLHAAGNYRAGGQRLPDLYVSSYTPTLIALSRAREGLLESSRLSSVLLLGQSNTPGFAELPGVPKEITSVKARISHATVIQDEHGTHDAVLSALAQHQWAHLACHAYAQPNDPLRSHLALHDGDLTVIELLQTRLRHVELAFLSCCHSAAGSSQLPDEFLHIAGAMQFAGFKCVIGTLWPMDDAVGPTLADEFYRMLLGRGNGDYRQSAKALSNALKILRRGRVPLRIWTNFMHWGI
ncbi:hypothetical protein FRB99_005650 [Tulasnella sp. 403]|nr:hypothetical protein FRB99_005650 [Tulasnella sp. 403]